MEQKTGVSYALLLRPSGDIMMLADDVKLLKVSGRPFDSQTAKAAMDILRFLDWALLDWAELGPRVQLPRDYFYEITGISECLCVPYYHTSDEEGARMFATDVATGFLEELCEVLEPELSATVRSELGL
jgi:hypothetical protein